MALEAKINVAWRLGDDLLLHDAVQRIPSALQQIAQDLGGGKQPLPDWQSCEGRVRDPLGRVGFVEIDTTIRGQQVKGRIILYHSRTVRLIVELSGLGAILKKRVEAEARRYLLQHLGGGPL